MLEWKLSPQLDLLPNLLVVEMCLKAAQNEHHMQTHFVHYHKSGVLKLSRKACFWFQAVSLVKVFSNYEDAVYMRVLVETHRTWTQHKNLLARYGTVIEF